MVIVLWKRTLSVLFICLAFVSYADGNDKTVQRFSCEKLLLHGHSFPRTYHVMPRLIEGGLVTIREQLPNLAAAGVEALWLGPVHSQTLDVHYYIEDGKTRSTVNDHGYWVADHSTVDPKIGGEVALRQLIDSARQLGIDIFLDIPINQLGYGEELIFQGEAVNPRERPDLFLQSRELDEQDYRAFEELVDRQELLDKQDEMAGLRLMGLNDLNHRSPLVRSYLVESYKKFVDMGIAGFRVDAVKHLPIEFVVWFINQIQTYTVAHDKPFLFLLEFLTHREATFDIFTTEIISQLQQPETVYFIDFPWQAQIRSTHWNPHQLADVAHFLRHHRGWDNPLAPHYVPMFQDHDFGTPIDDPVGEIVIQVIGDFTSLQPTMIHHGGEAAGRIKSGRHQIRVFRDGDVPIHLAHVENSRLDIDPVGKGVQLSTLADQNGVTVFVQEGDKGFNYLISTMNDHETVVEYSADQIKGINHTIAHQYFRHGASNVEISDQGTVKVTVPARGYILLTTVKLP